MMYSFAWTSILIPAGVMGGGLNGIGLLIYYATGGTDGGIPLGVTFLVLNAVLVGVASLLISLKFGAKTIYAIGFISVAMAVMQQAVPGNVLGLADDKLLSAILGGALAGAGISICFTQGGSTGGTDIIALIINKYKTVSYGKVLMLCDLIIIGCSLFIFKNITSVIYGYVMVAVFGYTIDAVMAGNRQSAQILIVSPKYDQIAERIFSEMHRGVTLLDGEGWYTKTPTKVVMVVCRKNETGHPVPRDQGGRSARLHDFRQRHGRIRPRIRGAEKIASGIRPPTQGARTAERFPEEPTARRAADLSFPGAAKRGIGLAKTRAEQRPTCIPSRRGEEESRLRSERLGPESVPPPERAASRVSFTSRKLRLSAPPEKENSATGGRCKKAAGCGRPGCRRQAVVRRSASDASDRTEKCYESKR